MEARRSAAEGNFSKTTFDKYLEKIEEVCPWSKDSYDRGKLCVKYFRSYSNVLDNIALVKKLQYEAIVFFNAPNDLDDLDRWVDEVSETEPGVTIFWSHPGYTKHKESYATPVPCIIIQNTKHLEETRRVNRRAKTRT